MNSNVTIKILFIGLLFLFATKFKSFANSQQKNALKEFDDFHIAGKNEATKGNYIKSIEYFTKAEMIAEKSQLTFQLAQVKCSMGVAYRYISNYGEAMKYYLDALEITKANPKFKELTLRLLSNIGTLYTVEENNKAALEYYLKAYKISKEIKSTDDQTFLIVNISDAYNGLGDFKKARYYLDEIKTIPKEKLYKEICDVNYAESYFIEGNLDKAREIMENVFKSIKNRNESICYSCMAELLAKIYAGQNKIDLAILYAKKGLKSPRELKDKINLYDQLSGLYLRNKQYKLSVQYKDSVILAKDSLSVLINRGLFETNKMKLKIKDYQDEAKLNKEKREKYELERKLFIIGILFSLLLFFFIYRSLKNRIIKQKQEKIIVEDQQKIIVMEMEGLKNNIAEKNRRLSAKALYLSSRNELIEEVINALSQMPQITRNKEVFDYAKTLKSYIKTDEEWEDFINYFEQVNPEFLKNITLKYPDISTSDLRFICYIYMNLDIKEISSIFNITTEAVRKRKQRIAKKLDIDADEMYEHLLKMA